MQCRMCEGQFAKLAKAHIYPDSLYKHLGLYEPDPSGQGRVHVAHLEGESVQYSQKGRSTGLYDSNILCTACDNHLNKIAESKAKLALFDAPRTIFNFQEDIGIFPDLDYTITKLFFLAMFYRASLSEYMPSINLGYSKERQLRKALQNGQAGSATDFALWFLHINDHPKTFSHLSSVRHLSVPNNTRYSFLAGGLFVSLYVYKREIPDVVIPHLLSPTKPLQIVKLEAGKGARYLDWFNQTGDSYQQLDEQGIL